MLAPGATRSVGAGSRALAEAPIPGGPVSSGTGTGSCTRRPSGAWPARPRSSSSPPTTSGPGSPMPSRLPRWRTAISRACRLNVALTEAIALGHDCGHGPGGHASEEALSPFLAEGFDHAVWGADVTAVPLNLCAETLDGIRNHSWSRPSPATPEGEVVALADRDRLLRPRPRGRRSRQNRDGRRTAASRRRALR